MKKISTTTLLLNGAALLTIVATAGAALRTAFVREQVAPCTERFAHGTRFALDVNGEPMSIERLQGEMASTDWGLQSGARVVKAGSSSAKHALELDLASAPGVAAEKRGERPGIGFEWMPQSFGRQQSACLRYSVFVPKGFAFGQGGRLPGLQASSSDGEQGPRKGFSALVTWTANGELDGFARPTGGDGHAIGRKTDASLPIMPGKWTELEQELVLNTPGAGDGVLRIWHDGKLVLEKTNIAFRTKADVALTGVLAEAAGSETVGGKARGSQKIQLSPFELRWN